MPDANPEQTETNRIDDERVRDHLANERTYLAWLRTGLSTVAFGVVIAKLRYILGPNYPASGGIIHAAEIGLILAVTGVITMLMSVMFFLKTREEIRTRSYSSKIYFAIALAVVMVTLGSLILWYLMQSTPTP
jgi:putative membrane protein